MAKLDNLLDGSQGKLGNLVFYQVRGKNIVRTKPGHYKDRKSPAQLAQRQRLQVMNRFLRPFREPIRTTFASEAVDRSALQAAQSYNMKNALAGEYPGIYVDTSKALLSRGSLPLPVRVTVEAHPDGLLIQWENGPEASGMRLKDTLVVFALDEESGNGDFKFTVVHRKEGRYVWNTSITAKENTLPDVWVAFRNTGMTEMSDSLYAEK